jgi:orotate phosphoribosyltransferase
MAGVASAGVPHAAFLAHELNTPMVYVRSKKKEHGRQNRVEGELKAGQEVLVVEDLVNQGGSVADAVEALRDEGAVVNHVICLVSYQLPAAQERLKELKVKLHYLCDFDSILEEVQSRKEITQDQLESLRRWQKDPKNWRP